MHQYSDERIELLHLERLEDRLMLDGSFSNGPWVELLDFTQGEVLTISDAPDDFVFELTNGVWNGTDRTGVTGSGTQQLRADKNVIGNSVFISDSLNTGFETYFDDLDATDFFFYLEDVGNVSQVADSVIQLTVAQIFSVGNVFLDGIGNDFLRVTLTAQNASIYDANEIVLEDTKIANDFSITTGGLIDVVHNDLSVGGKLNVTTSGDVDFNYGDYFFSRLSFHVDGEARFRSFDDIWIEGENYAGSLSLFSYDNVFDADDAVIRIGGDAVISAREQVVLADDPNGNATGIGSLTDVLDIGGNAKLGTNYGDATLAVGVDGNASGQGAQTTFGTLSFFGSSNIVEDDDTIIDHFDNNSNGPTSYLTSAGDITSVNDPDIHMVNTIVVAGGKIVLGDDPNRNGTGQSYPNTDQVFLHSSSLTASGDILIGMDGTNLGDGTYARSYYTDYRTPSTVRINSDHDLLYLRGTTDVGSFFINTVGDVLNTAFPLEMNIAGRLQIDAGGNIDLDGYNGSSVNVGGWAILRAGDSISLGQNENTSARFGQLTFYAPGIVDIVEKDSTYLKNDNHAGSLSLKSLGNLAVHPGTTIQVDGNGHFDISGNVRLAMTQADQITVAGQTTIYSGGSLVVGDNGWATTGQLNLQANSTATLFFDSDILLFGNVFAPSIYLTSAGSILDEAGTVITPTWNFTATAFSKIILAEQVDNTFETGGIAKFIAPGSIRAGEGGDTSFALLNFQGGGYVAISEKDSSRFVRENFANSLNLRSEGSVTDSANASVSITTTATLSAANRIYLADHSSNRLSINGRAVLSAESIIVHAAGLAELNQLNFQTNGYVGIQNDRTLRLAGDNWANQANLKSTGAVADLGNTSVSIATNLVIHATSGVLLADHTGDRYEVCNFAYFVSPSFVTMHSNGDVTFKNWFANSPIVDVTVDSDEC